MAENKILSALRHEAVSHVGDQFEDQLTVDFTGAAHTGASAAYNLASGDTFKAFNVPIGGIVTEAGWVTKLTDAGNPTFQLDLVDTTTGTSVVGAATAIGATGAWAGFQLTAGEVALATGAHVLVTGGAATCDDGKVTFFIKGIIVKDPA